MKYYILIIASLCASLTACGKADNPVISGFDNKTWKVIHIANIELKYPAELTERPSADDHRIIDNDDNRNDLDHPQEYRIEITPQNLPCSPLTLGSSKTKESHGINYKILSGKVDFWDIYSSGEGYLDYKGEPPICTPSTGEKSAAYALCSGKDGKNVLICISQQTDDPKLANDIFDSFRWTN